MVPVLSRTIAFTLYDCSKASASLIRIWFSAPLPTPTIIAVGVARPNAHGHAITSTLIAEMSACAKCAFPPAIIHTAKVITETDMITGTNTAAILSTNFCTGTLLP